MNRRIKYTVAALTLLLCLPAFAESQTYSNYSDWAARSTSLTSVNLNSLAPAGGYSSMGYSFTANGANFSSPDGGLYVVDPQFNPSTYTDWHTGLTLLQVNWGTLNVNFSASTSASFYLNSIPGYGNSFVVSFLSGGSVLDSYAVNPDGYPTATFFGYTSSNSFDSIRITPDGSYTLFSGLNYGQDPPSNDSITTPEPASLMLLGSGLAAVAFRKRKK